MKKSTIKWLVVAAIIVIALFFVLRVDVAAYWKTYAGDKNFGINISGKTEAVGKDGKTISLVVAQKVSMLPLSFYYQGIEVTAMRVTLTWTTSGEDVDWSTLQLSIKAEGTGGYRNSFTSTLRSGSAVFVLPISVSQLGRTPYDGEQVTWQMIINVQGTVKSTSGTILTAQAKPITCQIVTVWREPKFSISSSASTSVDGSTSSGGCGLPEQHAVWVYNVQPEGISKYQDLFPMFGVFIYTSAVAGLIYGLAKKAKEKQLKLC